jgi:hypothetical protein
MKGQCRLGTEKKGTPISESLSIIHFSCSGGLCHGQAAHRLEGPLDLR